MLITSTKRLSHKLFTLGLLIAALLALNALVPRPSSAQYIGQSHCASEVYNYCFSEGRHVDPYTCECNPYSCVGVAESDCTEQGMYLSYSDCACHSNPSYISVCDSDPYALGCKRSFDTVFAGQLRTFGDDGDICSFNSFTWCVTSGGSWSSYGCACSGLGSSTRADCENNGGAWYDPGTSAGGGRCGNPSDFGAGSECANPSHTLSSCVASGGYWNPYKCKCTPEP